MTAILHTPPKKRRNHRQIVTPPGIPMKTTGHDSDSYCVAAFDLAQVLNVEIEKIDAENNDEHGHQKKGGAGGIYALAARAAAYSARAAARAEKLGHEVQHHTSDGLVRRLWSIRSSESRAIGAEMAESFLIPCDLNITEIETIAHLPGGMPAALNAVDAHWEFNETEPLDEMARQRLAKMLLGFARGYLAGVNADITTDVEEWARYVSGFRLDRWNRSPNGKLDPVLRRGEDDAAA